MTSSAAANRKHWSADARRVAGVDLVEPRPPADAVNGSYTFTEPAGVDEVAAELIWVAERRED